MRRAAVKCTAPEPGSAKAGAPPLPGTPAGLLARSDAGKPCGHGQDHVDLPMSRNDIADYLGLTIETVSRTFTRLKNEGLLALPNNARVDILDRDGLTDLAGGYTSGD